MRALRRSRGSKRESAPAARAVLLAAVAAAAPLPALARNWNVNSGNWSIAGFWNPAGVPVAGDQVNIVFTDGVARTVTLDVTTPSLGLFSIDLTGAGTDASTLSDTGGFNLTAAGIFVGGYSGSGTTNGRAVISQPTGAFATSAGTDMVLGYGAGSSGIWTLSNSATLTSSQSEFIGYSGTGTFTQSGNSVNTLTASAVGNMWIGYNAGSTGNYNLNGGTLSCASHEYVGWNGTGNFTQTGGANSAAIFVDVGVFGGSTGVYNQTGGSLNTVSLYAGDLGNGAFSQSNAAATTVSGTTAGNGLYLGYNSGNGTFTLGGSATLNVAATEYIGHNGNGFFNQTGGVNTTGFLIVGNTSTGNGTYSLSGGAVLNTTNTVYIGNNGKATFLQSGADFIVGMPGFALTGPDFYIAANSGSVANYFLSNGATLSIPAAASTEYLGFGGTATFTQTGGTHHTTHFEMASYGSATYNLSGGDFSGGFESLALNGNALFNQSGGTNSSGEIDIGLLPPASGTYNLSGGILSPQSIYVGGAAVGTVVNGGRGVFNQSGGANNIQLGLHIAEVPGASGTFTLTGGSMIIARGSTATTSGIFLAQSSNTVATLNLLGGTTSAPILLIGNNSGGGGAATATVSNGATLTLAPYYALIVPGPSGTTNRLSFYSGTINTGGIFTSAGPASFLWVGGTINLTGLNGQNGATPVPGSNPVFDASALTVFSQLSPLGPDLTLGPTQGLLVTSGDDEFIGGTAGGSIVINGGTHVVSGTIHVGAGGVLSHLSGTFSYGGLVQTGGTITNNLTNTTSFTFSGGSFGGALLNQGTATISGPFAPAGNVENDAVLNVGPGGSIAAGGAGLLNLGTLNLSGGTIGGSNLAISDFGAVLNASGGAITAPLLNNGSLNLSGNLTAGSVTNVGTMNFSGPSAVLRPQLLTNAGLLTLGGGAITGGGALNNIAVISGSGAITVSFSNSGMVLVPSGILNVGPAFTNGGYVQLGGASANVTGSGPIANRGSIQGIGTVLAPVNNLAGGTIEPLGGGTLGFLAPVTNAASGLIRAGAGNKLLMAAGLAANFGTIDLVGGTFDDNGRTLVNSGIITGFGTFSAGGWVNNPGQVITFSGDLATVNGPVTNSAGASIRANLSPVLFTGPVVNNGTIKVNGAPMNTVTFASSYSGAGQYISDPADNYFQDINVAIGGLVSGATGDRFFINGTYVNAGTYANAGGFLSAQNVINNGSFNQTAGQATTLALSGTGSTTIGGGAAAALVSVASLSQGSVTINSGGTLIIRPATPRLTNAATNLQINGTGTLDLGNHELLTNTAPATIKSYLTNAYDPNGNADWARPGLTSSVAKANPVTYSLGYAYGSDQSAQDAGVTTKNGTPLSANQTIVRPVLTGDANMDGTVDFFDITQILGYKYNTGQAASYTDGDLDYSGKVDFFDIVLLLSANYNSGQTYLGAHAHAASPTLSGVAMASATTIGTTGDGKPDFEYNPATGDLRFRTDGGTFTTTGGSASFVSSLTISSASGILLGGGASAAFAGGTGATLTSTLLSSALTNSPGFGDGFDIGLVLAPGLSPSTLTADLTVKYQSLNGGSLKTADITVPEPAGLALLSFGAAALMARRRRRTDCWTT
jgi:hypothetical protein